jgi:hypothetical protein
MGAVGDHWRGFRFGNRSIGSCGSIGDRRTHQHGHQRSPVHATNASGQYTFTSVRPGPYKISVKMAGFRVSTVPSVLVEVNKSTELDLKLEVGADNQVVEVQATAVAQLQTTDAQIGNSISMSQISRLPALEP